MEILAGFVGAVLGAIAAGLTTYFTTRRVMQLELQHTYDMTLRDIRLPHYQRLFNISRCIPREWPQGEVPSGRDLLQFRENFHDWYFGDEAGGMFLPEATRTIYFKLQNALENIGHSKLDLPDTASDSSVSSAEGAELYKHASTLRHQLAWDVGAAQPPRLRWVRLGPTLPSPAASHKVWAEYASTVHNIDTSGKSKQYIVDKVYAMEA